MPVYNCESYIEESIRSIVQQTYDNWELIIVNDGSSDKTGEKIEEIEDERIQIVSMKQHEGLAAAFAEGYKLVRGEFVVRHDGDDLSSSTRLEMQVDFLERNPEVGMVACLISCFTREPLFRKDCIFVERIQNHYINDEEIKKAVLGGFIPILFPTLMIRKTLLDKVDIQSKHTDFNDHTELLLELLQISSVEKINSILYYYRRHQEAYHVINQKQYEQSTAKLLKKSTVKNHLQYKDFYKAINILGEDRIIVNQKSSIRVLMLIDALNIGGTETHVLNVTKRLIESGIYVVVATSGGPMEGIFQSHGIKVRNIPFDGDYLSNKKKNGIIKLVKAIIDEEGINLIHSHLFASMQLASEIYRMYQIPYVVTVHGLFYPNDVLYSSCIKASKVIAVSEPVKRRLGEKLGSKVKGKTVVIPNGISRDIIKSSHWDTDIREELGISRSARILCYCSRLDWNKTTAARVLLFSFSQLLEEFSNLHVIIVGDGPGRESLEKEVQIINEMAERKIVHIVGAKVDVIPYYLESSIVIGTARVALEGMICSKPVIAVGNQGYTGIVNESRKDIQYDMYFGDHDAVEKPNVSRLVRDLRYLLKSRERRIKIGRWGRRWCEKVFDLDDCVKDIIKIYEYSLYNAH